ncbi:glycosyltransferase 87 family protein [Psychromarinibacter sp. S121]|uniref:glycosyltransferase 87 family protein n=1 Tax=Psychromarinibacter sp. S121 TaxID=3415127 RepID=UPI003C7E36EF
MPAFPITRLVPGLAILAVWAVWAALRWWGHWPADLSALYFAGHFHAEGMPAEIYASPARFFGLDMPQSWTDAATAAGHPGVQTFPYVYPPLWAVLMAPLAAWPPQAVFDGFLLWHLALLVLAPVLAFRIMRPAISFTVFAAITAALLTTSVITEQALFQNQPQITVAFLTLLSFERLTSDRDTEAGLALGLAAAIKLSPILLLAIFLIERRFRAAATAVATVAALAVLSLALAGPELHLEYLRKLSVLGDQLVIWDLNLSLKAALFQMSELVAGRRLPASTDGPLLLESPGWLAPAVFAALLAGAAAIWAATRNAAPDARLRHRLAAGVTLLTLCAPLAWAHHYLVPLFLVPGLIGAMPTARAAVLILAFGLLYADRVAAGLPGWLPLNLTTPISVAGMGVLAAVFALTARRKEDVR